MDQQKPGTFFGRNPVLIYLLVQAIVGAIVAFGLDFTGDQIYAIMTLTNVLIAIIANTQVVPLPVAQAKIDEALNTTPPITPEELKKAAESTKKAA